MQIWLPEYKQQQMFVSNAEVKPDTFELSLDQSGLIGMSSVLNDSRKCHQT